jgi:hypothetical protein
MLLLLFMLLLVLVWIELPWDSCLARKLRDLGSNTVSLEPATQVKTGRNKVSG